MLRRIALGATATVVLFAADGLGHAASTSVPAAWARLAVGAGAAGVTLVALSREARLR